MDSPDDEAAAGLEAMKYRDLQKVAKEVGVKANLPKAQLVQKILEARSSKGEEDRVELVDPSPKVATPTAKTVTPTAKSATPKAEQARRSKGSSAKKAITPKAQSIRKPIAAKSATPSKADPLRARLSSTPASILKAKMKANRSVSTAEKLAKAMSDMTPDSIELVTPSPQRLATPNAKLVTPKAKLVTPKAEMVTKKAKGTPKMVRMKTPVGGRATPSAAAAMKSVKKTPYTASHKKKTPAPAAAAAPTGIPRFVPKKAPDFAKLHAKEFGKMDSLDVYLSKKKDRSIKKVARNVAKERFEKAREITREHRAEMDRLSKRVTPAAAADKPVRRSPRNNAENNPPPPSQVQSSNTFVPSNLVVGEFNFGGVSKRPSGTNKAFKFTASPARSAKPALAEKTNNRSKAGSEAAVSVKRPMGYKPHTGKLKDWNEVQREKRMAMAAGKAGGGRIGGPSGGPRGSQVDRRQVIKGVRMNKRAELLLKKRQLT